MPPNMQRMKLASSRTSASQFDVIRKARLLSSLGKNDRFVVETPKKERSLTIITMYHVVLLATSALEYLKDTSSSGNSMPKI
jgi:hypothetical protein